MFVDRDRVVGKLCTEVGTKALYAEVKRNVPCFLNRGEPQALNMEIFINSRWRQSSSQSMHYTRQREKAEVRLLCENVMQLTTTLTNSCCG